MTFLAGLAIGAAPTKASIVENFGTLGKKMKLSGERFISRVSERAMGRKK